MGRPKGSKNKPKEPVVETEVVSGEAGEPHHVSRASLIEEIAAQNNEQRDEEMGEEVYADEEEGGFVTKTDYEAKKEAKEPEEEIEDEIEAKEEVKEEIKEEARKKYIIDGEEIEFTEAEVAAIVQKHKAADKRLEEATQLLKDAKATRIPEPSTPPPEAPSSTEDAELEKELTNAIVYGDEEQVAKAVKTLLGEGRRKEFATQTQNMSPEQIQGYVVETIAFQNGARLLETSPEEGGFSDIWSDPVLKAEFQRREDVKRDNGDNRPYVELYKEIGNEIREWQDNLIKSHLPKSGLEDRQDAKRKAGVVRGAGANTSNPTESRPLSARERHEQALAEAAAARGQT